MLRACERWRLTELEFASRDYAEQLRLLAYEFTRLSDPN